jgi:hypothetical protein
MPEVGAKRFYSPSPDFCSEQILASIVTTRLMVNAFNTTAT